MTTTTLLDRLGLLSTTSLVDASPALRILPPRLRPVAPGRHVVGRIVTARADRDLMSVIHALRRGLAGLVILGRSRDTATLAALRMPVWSTGFAPNAYAAKALPETGVSLSLDGVRVDPGELVVGDDDGLVVGSDDEFAAAVDGAEAIEVREKGLQARLLDGASLFDVMNYDEHLAALRDGRPGGLAFG